jgi:hypothetical protein
VAAIEPPLAVPAPPADTPPPPVPAPPAVPAPAGQPVDGLALWDAEDVAGPRESLALLRLDQNERYVIVFTTTILRVLVHFLDFAAIRGFVKCNGPDCLLCRIGRRKDTYDLLPVYDVLARAVAVLAISPTLRQHALRPQLTPVLRRVAGDEGPLLVTLRRDGYTYTVSDSPLPEGADDGAVRIRAFRELFEAGEIDLASPYPTIEDSVLAEIDEVKTVMALKGIEP